MASETINGVLLIAMAYTVGRRAIAAMMNKADYKNRCYFPPTRRARTTFHPQWTEKNIHSAPFSVHMDRQCLIHIVVADGQMLKTFTAIFQS